MAAGSYQVDVLLDAKAQIGEGPVYEEETNELLWVDIPGKTINFLSLKDGSNRQLQFTKTVGAVIPCKTGSNVIAVLGQSVCMVDRTTGELVGSPTQWVLVIAVYIIVICCMFR